jgi:hypothetical protein
MILRRFIVTVAMLTICGRAFGSDAGLVGCPDPNALAAALRNLGDRDWGTVSELDLQSTWPTKLSGTNCSAGRCQTLEREDRAIDGKCAWWVRFHFEADRDDRGDVTKERLSVIVTEYASTDRDEAVSAERMFSRALGLSESEVHHLGRNAEVKFGWKFLRGKQVELNLMIVSVKHEQGEWNAHVYLSRNVRSANSSDLEEAGGSEFGRIGSTQRFPRR